jgi:hypothetical protein
MFFDEIGNFEPAERPHTGERTVANADTRSVGRSVSEAGEPRATNASTRVSNTVANARTRTFGLDRKRNRIIRRFAPHPKGRRAGVRRPCTPPCGAQRYWQDRSEAGCPSVAGVAKRDRLG